ncbi:sphingomyelin phosphodiesterase-like [Brevipalpus obovatus]|uniref:sphingomyelin phosphodiesterase-like n=1 Tax=Brevipalpus obovatus TaxID=246614 RepID=UPI003D9EC8A9
MITNHATMYSFRFILIIAVIFISICPLFLSTDCFRDEIKENSNSDIEKSSTPQTKILNYLALEEKSKVDELEKIFKNVQNFVKNSGQSYHNRSNNGRAYDFGASEFFQNILLRITNIVGPVDLLRRVREGVASQTVCVTCRILAVLLQSNSLSSYTFLTGLRMVCISTGYQKKHICHEMMDHIQSLTQYVQSDSRLTADEMCGVSIGLYCSYEITEKLNWTIEIPEPKSVKISQPIDRISNASETRDSPIDSTFYVGLISDTHIDPLYVPGAETNCEEPVCCRPYNGISQTIANMAGVWGAYYSCDTPLITVDSVLQQLHNSSYKLNYVISGGDIVPHDVWNYRKAKTLGLVDILDLAYLRNLKVPVYSVVGNHEAIPVNCFAPSADEIRAKELSSQWLYLSLAHKWRKWIPEESMSEFKRSGNYVLKIRKGFRVIGWNTNYCARLNVWILYDTVDLGGSLRFLINALQEAEDAGDVVHIYGHVAPDHRECTQAWLHNFLRILERYGHLVKAQFYGHTHRDEFRVYYSLDNPAKPIGFGIINPALTSYSQTNPAYRIFKFNEKAEIVDYYTYYLNLTQNHSRNEDHWQLGYKASTFLDFNGPLTEHVFDRAIKRLETDSNYFQRFHRIFYVFSDHEMTQDWDESKRIKIISDLRIQTPMEVTPHI